MGFTWRKALGVAAVTSDLLGVLTIALASANVFGKIKRDKMLDFPVYHAITWEHNVLIPASFLLLTGTFITIYLILSEDASSEIINPL